MTAAEAVKLLATLAAAYPRNQLSKETTEVYAHDLRDIDAGLAAAAVERVRRSSKFFPTIAEIREAAAELFLDAPSPLTAWGHVLARARHRPSWANCGDCGGSGYADIDNDVMCRSCGGTSRVATNALPPLHPSVQEAMELTTDSVGWREGEAPALRKVFLESYSEVKRRAILAFVAPRPQHLPGRVSPTGVGPGVTLPELPSV